MLAIPRSTPQAVVRSARLMLGAIGGYALTNGYIGFVGAALASMGWPKGEAVYFGLLSGMALFVSVLIWFAATRRLAALSLAVLVAAAFMNIVAPLMTS